MPHTELHTIPDVGVNDPRSARAGSSSGGSRLQPLPHFFGAYVFNRHIRYTNFLFSLGHLRLITDPTVASPPMLSRLLRTVCVPQPTATALARSSPAKPTTLIAPGRRSTSLPY